jgi:hypothetical protein
VGFGVGAGVGAGVGGGVRAGVGRGVGAGVGAGATENESVLAGNLPEPHFVLPPEPGLSYAAAVHDDDPDPVGVTVIVNAAVSPAAGRPTRTFWSSGSMNATFEPLTTAIHPVPDDAPLTDEIDASSMVTSPGTVTMTQPISSPPPSPPVFLTLIVTVVVSPTSID